jgi:hypothetical protein
MSNIETFLAKTTLDCQKHGIGLHFVPEKSVNADGVKCSGYFDNLDLKVAFHKKDWLDVLVHESCHMDQWLSGHPLWKKADAGIHGIDQWCKSKTVCPTTAIKCFKTVIELEWDCEKRTTRKIKKYNLNIDLTKYKQQCNAYLFSYWATFRDRKWYPFPYNNPKIVRVMPKRILPLKEYHNPDTNYLKHFE